MINEILLRASNDGRHIIFHFEDNHESCEIINNNKAIVMKNGILDGSYELLCLPCGCNTGDEYIIDYIGSDGRSIFSPEYRADTVSFKSRCNEIPPAMAFRYLVAKSIPLLRQSELGRYVPDYEKCMFVNNTRSCIIEEDTINEGNIYSDGVVITTLIPLYFYYGEIDHNRVVVVRMRLFNRGRESAIEASKDFVNSFF